MNNQRNDFQGELLDWTRTRIQYQWNRFWHKVDTWAVRPGLTPKQLQSRKNYAEALTAIVVMSVAIGAMVGFTFVFIGTLHLIINYPDQLGIAILAGMPLFFLGWTIRVLLFKPQPISAGDEEVNEFEEPALVWDEAPVVIWGIDKARIDSDPWAEDWSEWTDFGTNSIRKMSEEERRSLLEE